MKKLAGESLNIMEENLAAMQQLFPEAFEEGKIDFDVLRQLLGDYVDDEEERYSFRWNGKGKSLRLSQTPSTGTLRPCKEESKDWNTTENLYIEGDNLEVLKLLQKSYHGKVKMIYIDPPYNTGKDFVYKDDFRDNVANYKRITGQVDDKGCSTGTNSESNGRFHTDWLNMMYPRLRLARNLLSDDGVIFISIDDNELDNLKKICDEVFGAGNFLGNITWSKKRKGSFLSKMILSFTEYSVVYCKNINFIEGLYGGEPDASESQPIIKRTNSYSTLHIPAMTITTKLPDGVYKAGFYGEDVNPVKLLNDIVIEKGVIVSAFSISAPFIWSQEMFNKQLVAGSKFVINTANFQIRVYRVYEDTVFKGMTSYINGVEIKGTNEDAYEELKKMFFAKVFDYSKPVNYISKYINAATHFTKNAIVLDFFSGSATTAHAVMRLNAEDGGNRRFILVQLPETTPVDSEARKAGYENICEIGKERIRRAGEKVKAECEDEERAASLDVGFKVFKLDSSNLQKWQPQPEDLQGALQESMDNFLPDRTNLDVVYEIALKLGLDLSYEVEEREVDGQTVYVIGAGALMICLASPISTETAEALLKLHEEYAPETWQVVFRDTGFLSDQEKTNIKETLKSAGLDEDAFISI